MKARWYLCEAISTDLIAGDDLSEVKFVDKTEIKSICSEKGVSLWPPKVVEYFNLD